MKKAILIGGVLFLLCGGTVGGLVFMNVGPFAGLLPEKEEKKPEPPAEPKAPQDLYYELGSFVVPLIAKGGISHQIGVDLALKVDAKAGARISADIPRLQNAITFDLYDFLPRHADATSAVDRKAVHDRLVKLATRMYGDGAIHDIIIKSMYER